MNKAKSHRKLKENIIIMKSQRSDIKRGKIIKDGKKMRIDEIIKQNKKFKS